MRDVMAGMKAVIYRRTTSNSVGHLGPKCLVGGAKFRGRFCSGLNWVGCRFPYIYIYDIYIYIYSYL